MLRLHYDLVCPFSALLLDEVAALDVPVELVPFELRPAPEPLPDPRGADVRALWREHVEPLTRAYGVELLLPVTQPRSTLALAAGSWAQEQGRGEAWRAAARRAYFLDGRDLGDEDVLRALAAACGLDGDDAVEAAWDPGRLARLRALREAALDAGVEGVPALSVDDVPVLFGTPQPGRLAAALRDWDGTPGQLQSRLSA